MVFEPRDMGDIQVAEYMRAEGKVSLKIDNNITITVK